LAPGLTERLPLQPRVRAGGSVPVSSLNSSRVARRSAWRVRVITGAQRVLFMPPAIEPFFPFAGFLGERLGVGTAVGRTCIYGRRAVPRFWPITHPPPISSCPLTWRQVYERGSFFQRELVSEDRMRDALRKREVEGSRITIPWRDWDAEGAVRPLAFSKTAYTSGMTMPAIPADHLVFVDERPAEDSWDDYAWDAWGHPHPSALYSPWQLLPLVVVFSERAWSIPVSMLLDPTQLARWAKEARPQLEVHAERWRQWHGLWEPTIKVLVRLQNRYWPPVHGRFNVLTDRETGAHYDPEDGVSFDPHGLLSELDLSEEHLAESYRFLARGGQRGEPGDRLHLLRQETSRRRRRDFEGQARVAQDFYDAAEMFRGTRGHPDRQTARGEAEVTGTELRAYHEDRLSRLDRKADRPGLGDSLVVLARRPEHGTITLAKPELAEFLCRQIVDDFKAAARNDDARKKLFRKRPILRHLVERVLDELATMPLERPRRSAR
jgi:hypothetical protein